jgi:hypothetical protein
MVINIISTEEVWTSRKGKSSLFGTQEWQQLSEMLLHRRLQPGETVRVELSKETQGLVKHADRLMRNLLIERFSHMWHAGKIPRYRITTSKGVLYVSCAKVDRCGLL